MKKYFVKNQPEMEVTVGQTIQVTRKDVHPILGSFNVTKNVLLTQEIIDALVGTGELVVKHYNKKGNATKVPTNISYYIVKLADRMGICFECTTDVLKIISSVNPGAAFSMILREIAIELDAQYEDAIQHSPEIYIISSINSTISKINKEHVPNYMNFAAFRTLEDAKMAYNIMKPLIRHMFKKMQ